MQHVSCAVFLLINASKNNRHTRQTPLRTHTCSHTRHTPSPTWSACRTWTCSIRVPTRSCRPSISELRQMRQYLYICTSKCLNICFFVPGNVLRGWRMLLRFQYLYFCTSKASKLST